MLGVPFRHWIVIDISLDSPAWPLHWTGGPQLQNGFWLIPRISHFPRSMRQRRQDCLMSGKRSDPCYGFWGYAQGVLVRREASGLRLCGGAPGLDEFKLQRAQAGSLFSTPDSDAARWQTKAQPRSAYRGRVSSVEHASRDVICKSFQLSHSAVAFSSNNASVGPASSVQIRARRPLLHLTITDFLLTIDQRSFGRRSAMWTMQERREGVRAWYLQSRWQQDPQEEQSQSSRPSQPP